MISPSFSMSGGAAAGEHVGDIFEVARAHQTRADDRKETGVNAAVVTESVDLSTHRHSSAGQLGSAGHRARTEETMILNICADSQGWECQRFSPN